MFEQDAANPQEAFPLSAFESTAAEKLEDFDAVVGSLLLPAFKQALIMLDDPAAAEDAVQEAAFKAWHRQSQLRDGRLAKPWFAAIVANECRSMRRLRWWKTLRMPEMPERGAAVEDATVQGLDLDRAFALLTPDERLLIHLFFYDDMPLEQVATTVGRSLAATRSRLYRALGRLRPNLEMNEVSR
ncbi:MAG TPA: sigma-70 family RNA polymerase sigma factor [Candidatus Dormibacteraeota bacterium]|jgi:RNA polymerase sigma-70 factor (ECF subfamily)|nr:sigma-70 family RNA polymerase sigma factor [Candidatus Dormibacteraeota bacterium]